MRSVYAPERAWIELFLQFVERPAARGADVLSGDDGNHVVRERRVDHLVGLHEQKALADSQREPVAPVASLGNDFDNLLELLRRPSWQRRVRGGLGRPLECD